MKTLKDSMAHSSETNVEWNDSETDHFVQYLVESKETFIKVGVPPKSVLEGAAAHIARHRGDGLVKDWEQCQAKYQEVSLFVDELSSSGHVDRYR